MRMIKSGKFSDKKILLIDKEPKTKNDRTWCFWEKQDGFFEEIVYKKWDKLSFLSDEYSNTMDITPYQYKMIRGIDFYRHCFNEISKRNNIEIVYGVANVKNEGRNVSIQIDDQKILAGNTIVFNSFADHSVIDNKSISMLQHFKGWMIETRTDSFDPVSATFMDFRVDQSRGTTFTYVLPFSSTNALIEYTLFTDKLLEDVEYENELKSYIGDFLNIKDYKIIEKEFGVIPMTTKNFELYKNSIYNIGTVGGQTKASSGYTFQFIQKQSKIILDHLLNNKPLSNIRPSSKRFSFYDKVLLDVLANNRVSGKEVFTRMFAKNKPQHVLTFLDNESTLSEEMKIISTLPTLPFLKAAFNQF